MRTLTGHKSGIKCIDFHPYGEFLASGSSDTNIKIWDIRRKGKRRIGMAISQNQTGCETEN